MNMKKITELLIPAGADRSTLCAILAASGYCVTVEERDIKESQYQKKRIVVIYEQERTNA